MTTRTEIHEIANDTLRLHLHPGQLRAWDSDRRFVFVIAGTQGGKTAFGPWWLYREIYGGWGRAGRGSGDYIAVTSTFDLFKLKMLPALREVFEHILGIARYWSGDKVIELRDPKSGKFWATRADDPMWGRIILRSAQSSGGLESATANAAWLDEVGQDDFTLQAWEAVLRRIALHQGRVLGTTTPYNLGWLKQQIYDPWQRGADADIEVIQFTSTENPAFPVAEMELARTKLPDWKFRMFYKGQFERPAGQIYRAFIDAYREAGGHKVAPFVLPRAWPRYVGVDPGAVNQAKLWLAHDTATDTYYLYRERFGGEKSTAEHARECLDLAVGTVERVVRYYIGAPSETQQRMDWQNAGVANVAAPPVSDVESGIDRVIGLFKQHRLYIFDACAGTLDELGTYRRKLDKNGDPTHEIVDKNKYHHLDALRYVVAGVTEADANVVHARLPAASRAVVDLRGQY